MKLSNSFHDALNVAKELVYDKCGLDFSKFKSHAESIEYGACSFELSGKTIQFRSSKITPTKSGQFVTIWKRNKDGKTIPFDILDNIDFIIISTKSEENFGQFIFPKAILADKGIITRNEVEGKRGMRVYPPWDMTTSKQAEKTQCWQTKYFLPIKPDNSADFSLITELFN